MAVNQTLKEIKKMRKNNDLEIDSRVALIEVIEELIDCRKVIDDLIARITILETR